VSRRPGPVPGRRRVASSFPGVDVPDVLPDRIIPDREIRVVFCGINPGRVSAAANAAVPWTERLRWFRDLAGRASGLPLREAVRGLVVDPASRTLLVRFEGWRSWWTSPGGGVEPGETDEQALARELAEECGLREYELGRLVWTRESHFLDEFDADVVERALALVDRAEYKRRQAPPGVKLRPKAFGRDRRTPITNRWTG